MRLGVTAFGDMLSLTVTDVTALKQREVSFRLLFENNPMPMWVFDAARWNSSASTTRADPALRLRRENFSA